MTELTLEGIVSNITTLFSGGMSMAGTVGTTVTSNALLLTFVLVPIVGLGVGLFKRLINIR